MSEIDGSTCLFALVGPLANVHYTTQTRTEDGHLHKIYNLDFHKLCTLSAVRPQSLLWPHESLTVVTPDP
jgi:hypothetical protein